MLWTPACAGVTRTELFTSPSSFDHLLFCAVKKSLGMIRVLKIAVPVIVAGMPCHKLFTVVYTEPVGIGL